jgi:GTPase SAR1 family protein/predicted phosphodiesterase/uncharacterized Zn-finger protein
MRTRAETRKNISLRRTLFGHETEIRRLAWSANGEFLASASDDGIVRVWREFDGSCKHVLNAHQSQVYGLAFSPDSTVLATSGEDGHVHIWDISTGNSVHSTIHHRMGIWCIAFSPDGTLIASACDDCTIRLWQAKDGTLVRSFRHDNEAWAVEWSSDGMYLASGSADKTVRIWRASDGAPWQILEGHAKGVLTVTFSPNGSLVASASDDGTSRIWETDTGKCLVVLEGHTSDVSGAVFSFDGRLLATKSLDSSVRLWRCDTWEQVAEFAEPMLSKWRPAIAFHPKLPILATLAQSGASIRTWDVDIDALASAGTGHKAIEYTSAKIVIVGESGVGKSCLATRIAEDRYPQDYEQHATHGMRIWSMEAERLHRSAKPPEGRRRDVVLWDFGGQDEYQLVHQMFLHDTTLAMVVIDPTRGKAALDEARDWTRRLERRIAAFSGPSKKAVKLLVGAQIDEERQSELINRGAIHNLCEECGFAGFYETSALNGRKMGELRDALARALDWESFAVTSRPELFQRIRDDIEGRRQRGEVVAFVNELALKISRSESWYVEQRFDDENEKEAKRQHDFSAVRAVIDHLAIQGVIVKTKLNGSDDAIVLQLPVIERYAASIIVAARDNPRAVPALEASELGSPTIFLPGMTNEDRVPRDQERIVLECVAELMIAHGLCFRHEGLLVFPSLLRATESARTDELPGSVSLYFDFSGAIDNVYASLISWLVIGHGFGHIRLWDSRVEFEAEDRGVCGLRKVNRGGSFAHLDVYFHDNTSTRTQGEFISFVHQHLRSSGIDVVEHFELICGNSDCRYEFPRVVIQTRMAKGESDVMCPQCETRIKLSEGCRQTREQGEQAERKAFALMTEVRKGVPQIVASVKQRAFGRADDEYRTDRPIRVLHLSDLHFTSEIVPATKLQWLDDDIRKGNWLTGDELDYVVISGDMTHQGSIQGFRRASEFVSLLIDRFGLSVERFIFVPGNHDVRDLDEAYDWRQTVSDADKVRAVKEGRLFGLPNDKYYERLKDFSDQFFHSLLQKPYPLEPEMQGVSYTFPETRLQFLTLNSCWEIDQFHRVRASVHPDAVARLIAEADRQIHHANTNTEVKPEDYLRFGVWHHSVADVERGIRNREFLGNLQKNHVRVCLTGDVHEMRRELIDYWHENRIHILGAGSFGAKGQDLSEGSPRLYNLLEIDREFRSIRVHTRQQPRPNGIWKGLNEWPMPDGSEGGLPYFDISLMQPMARTKGRME